MSAGSVISLILFMTLLVFAATGSFLWASLCLIGGFLWGSLRRQSDLDQAHQILRRTKGENTTETFLQWLADAGLTPTEAEKFAQRLRHAMPRAHRSLVPHAEYALWDDLGLHVVNFEFDHLPAIATDMGRQFQIDAARPVADQLHNLRDLVGFLQSLPKVKAE